MQEFMLISIVSIKNYIKPNFQTSALFTQFIPLLSEFTVRAFERIELRARFYLLLAGK